MSELLSLLDPLDVDEDDYPPSLLADVAALNRIIVRLDAADARGTGDAANADVVLRPLTAEATELIGAERGAFLDAADEDIAGPSFAGEGSQLVVPVRSRKGLLFGRLAFAHRERGQFSERHAQWLELLASYAARLLDSAELERKVREAEQEQARREHELTRAIADRERLVQELEDRVQTSELLAGVLAHDLRNPLGAILAGADLLTRRGGVSEVQSKILARVLSSGERAARMIDDLLDFTQARLGGGLKVQRVASDLHGIVGQAVDEVEQAHPGRRIARKAHGIARGAWDGDRLAQVVTNLLRNALAYGPPDSTVTVSTESSDAHVVVSVHNWGPVIAENALGGLFEPFRRGKKNPDRSSKTCRSLGLGLYIVRQIVAAHGGTVDVASTEADGTTFSINLPRLDAADKVACGAGPEPATERYASRDER